MLLWHRSKALRIIGWSTKAWSGKPVRNLAWNSLFQPNSDQKPVAARLQVPGYLIPNKLLTNLYGRTARADFHAPIALKQDSEIRPTRSATKIASDLLAAVYALDQTSTSSPRCRHGWLDVAALTVLVAAH